MGASPTVLLLWQQRAAGTPRTERRHMADMLTLRRDWKVAATMTMHKGWRRRLMVSVEPFRYVGIGTAECGHLIVRQNHLAVGQRVYCGKCAGDKAEAPLCDYPLSDGRTCTRLSNHVGVHQ